MISLTGSLFFHYLLAWISVLKNALVKDVIYVFLNIFQERDQHHPDDKDDILEAFLPLK